MQNNNRDRTIGYYIREYRKKANMSQTELARRAKYHQSHISDIENNRRYLEDATLKKISDILNINFEYLVVLRSSISGHLKEELTKRAIEVLDKPLKNST